MGLLLGLITAIGWGLGDFLSRPASQSVGAYRTLFYVQFTGAIVLSIYLLASGELVHLIETTAWQTWAWAVLAISLNMGSSLALFQAFKIGKLSLVSPITSCYSVVTVILSLISGEHLTIMQAVGIGLVLLGIVGISIEPKTATVPETGIIAEEIITNKTVVLKQKRQPLKGLNWAIASALGYGLGLWMLGFLVTPHLGGVATTWLTRITTPTLIFVLAPVVRQSLKLPRGNVWWLLLIISITDTIAFVTFAIGLTLDEISIVTPLSSLYSAVTIILAALFLKERLHLRQWLSIGLIFAGILFVKF